MKFHSLNDDCTSRRGQARNWERVDSHLTHELLPVLIPCCADVIVWSQFLFTAPGVQEVLDVRHGDGSESFLKTERMRVRFRSMMPSAPPLI